MPATGRLVESAMRIRAESHEAWNEFVLAMREYAAAQTADMLRAPLEQLPRAQGMAMTANDIATTLLNAPKLYEKARNNG